MEARGRGGSSGRRFEACWNDYVSTFMSTADEEMADAMGEEAS